MRNIIYLISLFLISCAEKEPYFKVLKNKDLQSIHQNAFFDTLINRKNLKFIHVIALPPSRLLGWDAVHHYYLIKKDTLWSLEPYEAIQNGCLALQVINDSIIHIYSSLSLVKYGDFWVEVKNNNQVIYYTETEMKYQEGMLIKIGNKKFFLDSITMKSLKDTIYILLNDSKTLLPYLSYHDFKGLKGICNDEIKNLNPGWFYFSYPGRKIDYIVNLNQLKIIKN